MKKLVWAAALLASGCVVETTRTVYYDDPQNSDYQYSTSSGYQYVEPAPAVSVYVDPPLYQPDPIAVAWAPPPLLVEAPPPCPYDDGVWIGGYWVWEGDWVWAHGRWSRPPRRGYVWHQPYYEHRRDTVIFIDGHWSDPHTRFRPPPEDMRIPVAPPARGVRPGPRPIGPSGVFIPPPPGSREGLIIPAPIGTPPATIISAPPVLRQGMRVHNDDRDPNNYRITAPADVTSARRPYNGSAPAQADRAASQPPVIRNLAPEVRSGRPMSSYDANRPPINLPPAQPVRTEQPPASPRTPRQDRQDLQPGWQQGGNRQQQDNHQTVPQPIQQGSPEQDRRVTPIPMLHNEPSPIRPQPLQPDSRRTDTPMPMLHNEPTPVRQPDIRPINTPPQTTQPAQPPRTINIPTPVPRPEMERRQEAPSPPRPVQIEAPRRPDPVPQPIVAPRPQPAAAPDKKPDPNTAPQTQNQRDDDKRRNNLRQQP
ncbi:hypothetical protein [Uliginosibacterium gangwonense]|uniref:hypothetical protein n=1 Tax=Uliginosibacterium gangwonense TaxID=392736 RepID=UPI00035EB866|nr:hypothetical protein [Uliginosibacterium gangwonense]